MLKVKAQQHQSCSWESKDLNQGQFVFLLGCERIRDLPNLRINRTHWTAVCHFVPELRDKPLVSTPKPRRFIL
jgi:hypothetical protein